jgi:hypothetical protein
VIFSVAGFFVSCETTIEMYDFYCKSFFLGEEPLLIEGENIESLISRTPVPFDTLSIRIMDNGLYNTLWEIYATKLSESKYQVTIDVADIENTIRKEMFQEEETYIGFFVTFPKNFPAYGLRFFLNNNESRETLWYTTELGSGLYYQYEYEYEYVYVYVVKPIDLSRTWKREHSMNWKTTINTYHYDLNFSKSGWYKIVSMDYSQIGDDPNYSSGKNTDLW